MNGNKYILYQNDVFVNGRDNIIKKEEVLEINYVYQNIKVITNRQFKRILNDKEYRIRKDLKNRINYKG